MDIIPEKSLITEQLLSQQLFTGKMLINSGAGDVVKDIVRELENKAVGFEIAVKADIVNLFIRLFRFINGSARHQGGAFQKAFVLLERHYCDDITVRNAAQACNMSYSYFSRQFKKVTQKSFTEYLHDVRISEAERLLLNTDMSITEIAMSTGYSDTSYFIKRFRQIKKISPAQLRKQNINELRVI